MLRGHIKRGFLALFIVVGMPLLILFVYLKIVTSITEPTPTDLLAPELHNAGHSDSFRTMGNNWLRKSESGLYEMYVEGPPFERGVVLGRLAKDLVQYQEIVFNDQIEQLVPSPLYRNLLKYFVGWFNRNLNSHIQDEYRLEIFGVSKSFSDDYNSIAPPYQRAINYHAAHDIGHALQNMSLVGCTSFATWDDRSEDKSLIVGRNFDFFAGDDFAKNKLVLFMKPKDGHQFVSITWAGMMGVLSGMNDQGLTVTINAAKSDIPSEAFTPVSLVAREILQYASNIDEAYAIAAKRKMFVSESFLIGSYKDDKAVIIEKTENDIELFDSRTSEIICTNHFQSDGIGSNPLNVQHIKESASVPRFDRVKELLTRNQSNSISNTASILRDRNGLGDRSIGLGNERAINQLIAHHSVIFQPGTLRVWVSTRPWQLGKYVCYDLNDVFGSRLKYDQEIHQSILTIPEDQSIDKVTLDRFKKFSNYRFPFQSKEQIQPDSLLKWNPNLYLSYLLVGDYYFDRGEYKTAKLNYEKGLALVVATEQERKYMADRIQKCNEEL
ncbi:MAG: C45 family peptidase [Cyclobacteriaceae bacterium]